MKIRVWRICLAKTPSHHGHWPSRAARRPRRAFGFRLPIAPNDLDELNEVWTRSLADWLSGKFFTQHPSKKFLWKVSANPNAPAFWQRAAPTSISKPSNFAPKYGACRIGQRARLYVWHASPIQRNLLPAASLVQETDVAYFSEHSGVLPFALSLVSSFRKYCNDMKVLGSK